MPDPMVVEVVTPEQSLLAGPASAVMLRSSDGELTVLPGHTPLITDVVSGLVRVEREDGEARLAVHGGFLHVDTRPGAAEDEAPGSEPEGSEGRATAVSTRVTLLAGIAELAGDIDVARAEVAASAAESRIQELRAAGARDRSEVVGGESAPESDDDRALADAEEARTRAALRTEVAAGS